MSVSCLESLKILDISALREYDVDFKTIADLSKGKVNTVGEGGEGSAYLDMTLGGARE